MTIEAAEQEVELNDYTSGVGLQAGVGLWLSYPVTAKGKMQLTLMQTGERQQTGKIPVIGADGTTGPGLKVVDINLAISSSAIYLHQFGNKWAWGTGAGGKYEYFSQAKLSYKSEDTSNPGVDFKEESDNHYRRKFRVFLPIETHYKLTNRLLITGQVQVQLSNRLAAAETSFKEHDVGLWIGLDYEL